MTESQKYGEVLDLRDAASYLRITERLLYRLARQGKIPCAKISSLWRFQKSKLDQWLADGGQLKEEES